MDGDEIVGVDVRGARDAIEWRRVIFDAVFMDLLLLLLIGGGITILPNAIHASGIVSYKWRSIMLGINGEFISANLNDPCFSVICFIYELAS